MIDEFVWFSVSNNTLDQRKNKNARHLCAENNVMNSKITVKKVDQEKKIKKGNRFQEKGTSNLIALFWEQKRETTTQSALTEIHIFLNSNNLMFLDQIYHKLPKKGDESFRRTYDSIVVEKRKLLKKIVEELERDDSVETTQLDWA